MIKCYKGLFIPLHEGFPSGTVLKNLPAKAGDVRDVGSIPGLGRSPGVGNGNSLQHSCHRQRSLEGYGSTRKESDTTKTT